MMIFECVKKQMNSHWNNRKYQITGNSEKRSILSPATYVVIDIDGKVK